MSDFPSDSKTNRAAHPTSNPPAPPISDPAPYKESKYKRFKRYCNRNFHEAPIWIEAACAVVLVGITGTYTYYAGGQLHVMRDTLNLDRPWVGIAGSGSFRLDVAEDGPLSVTMNAQNVGRTPALNLVTVNKMETVGPIGHTPDFGGYSKSDAGPPVVLFPGSITTIRVDTTKPSAQGNFLAHLKPSEVEALKDGTVRIYVYGSIWYDDTLRTREHRTDYCFTYDPETSKASGIPNFGACKTHNYAD